MSMNKEQRDAAIAKLPLKFRDSEFIEFNTDHIDPDTNHDIKRRVRWGLLDFAKTLHWCLVPVPTEKWQKLDGYEQNDTAIVYGVPESSGNVFWIAGEFILLKETSKEGVQYTLRTRMWRSGLQATIPPNIKVPCTKTVPYDGYWLWFDINKITKREQDLLNKGIPKTIKHYNVRWIVGRVPLNDEFKIRSWPRLKKAPIVFFGVPENMLFEPFPLAGEYQISMRTVQIASEPMPLNLKTFLDYHRNIFLEQHDIFIIKEDIKVFPDLTDVTCPY